MSLPVPHDPNHGKFKNYDWRIYLQWIMTGGFAVGLSLETGLLIGIVAFVVSNIIWNHVDAIYCGRLNQQTTRELRDRYK